MTGTCVASCGWSSKHRLVCCTNCMTQHESRTHTPSRPVPVIVGWPRCSSRARPRPDSDVAVVQRRRRRRRRPKTESSIIFLGELADCYKTYAAKSLLKKSRSCTCASTSRTCKITRWRPVSCFVRVLFYIFFITDPREQSSRQSHTHRPSRPTLILSPTHLLIHIVSNPSTDSPRGAARRSLLCICLSGSTRTC